MDALIAPVERLAELNRQYPEHSVFTRLMGRLNAVLLRNLPRQY
jgi:hypothetical protein